VREFQGVNLVLDRYQPDKLNPAEIENQPPDFGDKPIGQVARTQQCEPKFGGRK
jgi:hypothetical protein